MGKGMPQLSNIKVISHPRITAKDMLCYILPKIHKYHKWQKNEKEYEKIIGKTYNANKETETMISRISEWDDIDISSEVEYINKHQQNYC